MVGVGGCYTYFNNFMNKENNSKPPSKCGLAALIGRPNVGKSTFLNKLLGQKISIVSPKVQTTRNRILGAYNFEKENSQIVFVDLPGIDRPLDNLGENCKEIALDSAKETDVILFIVEAHRKPSPGDIWIASWLRENCPKIPLIVLLNKIDNVKSPLQIDENIKLYRELFEEGREIKTIGISALKGEGFERLLAEISLHLPEAHFLFDEDTVSNVSLRFIAAELIREQILLNTSEEVPHSTAVSIQKFVEEPSITRIEATIHVETESQKGILIGKKGASIKKIGTEARIGIEELLEGKVFLDLKVKVSKAWRKDKRFLEHLGYV
jgi:GTP-binding protein Era